MPSKFRSSWTHKEGSVPAEVVQGRVVNVNVVKWTVDVVAQFDRKRYFNIQVGSPYMHHSNGEGVYIVPEVGATCMVCIPSDSSAPFVLAFTMAHELVDDATDDAPQGTNSHGGAVPNATDASFAGGRPKAIPGSIYMRTRDGNFVSLHRGGVLSLGATELAQRIYIPLSNLITDISENYEHHNSAGSVKWGIQDGPSKEKLPAQWQQTFRVFAADKYADVKMACGRVFAPVPEPDGGTAMGAAGVGQGADNPIIFEVAVSPKGFVAESGEIVDPSTVKNSVMKFTFDRKGNTLFRVEGNVSFVFKKKLTIKVTQDIDITTDGAGRLKAAKGFDIDGGAYTHVKGDVVRLGAGTRPVAGLGDIVAIPITVPAPILLTFNSPPVPGAPIACTIQTPPLLPLAGSITTGNAKVLI